MAWDVDFHSQFVPEFEALDEFGATEDCMILVPCNFYRCQVLQAKVAPEDLRDYVLKRLRVNPFEGIEYVPPPPAWR